jgi:hypothetical protein
MQDAGARTTCTTIHPGLVVVTRSFAETAPAKAHGSSKSLGHNRLKWKYGYLVGSRPFVSLKRSQTGIGHELVFASGQYFIVPQHSRASVRISLMKLFCALRRLCSSKEMRSNADLFGHSALRIGFPSAASRSASAGRQTIE